MIKIAAALLLLASTAPAQAMSGKQVAEIYQACSDAAYAACPKTTIYCRSYRPGYTKMCLMKNDVPPDYIFMLTH